MNTSEFTLLAKDELGYQTVKAELEKCPLCGARHTDYHTRNVYMVAWTKGSYYNAKVKCLNCGLEIKRTTEKPTGSLEESIRRVQYAWNRRETRMEGSLDGVEGDGAATERGGQKKGGEEA